MGVAGAEQLEIWLQFWAVVIVTVSPVAMFLIQVGLYVCNKAHNWLSTPQGGTRRYSGGPRWVPGVKSPSLAILTSPFGNLGKFREAAITKFEEGEGKQAAAMTGILLWGFNSVQHQNNRTHRSLVILMKGRS